MMLLARRYRTLEFEERKPFPCDGLIMYAVRIVHIPKDGFLPETVWPNKNLKSFLNILQVVCTCFVASENFNLIYSSYLLSVASRIFQECLHSNQQRL